MLSKEIYNLFNELKCEKAPKFPKGGSRYLIRWNLSKENRWSSDGYKWRQCGSLKNVPNMMGKLAKIIFYAYTGKNSWTYKFSKTCFVRSDRPNKVLVAYNGDESLAKKFNHKQINIARKKVYNNEDSDGGEDEDGDDNNEDGDDEVDEASDGDRILYMKRLPSSITEEEVMSLDPDIRKVLLDDSKNNSNTKYALLLFEDSTTAKGALSRLKGVIIDECNIVVDVLNELKSVSYCQVSDFPLAPTKDPKKLYVTGFGRSTTKRQLSSLFPTSSSIHYPIHPSTKIPIGYAFIYYDDEAEAKSVHDSSQGLVVNDNDVVVMFGKLEKKRQNGGRGGDDNDDDDGGDNDDDGGDDGDIDNDGDNDDDGGDDGGDDGDNDDDCDNDDDGDNDDDDKPSHGNICNDDHHYHRLEGCDDDDDDDDDDGGGGGENDNENNGNENIKAAGRISS